MAYISVLIHTKNEQQDLTGCLQSVSWSDDIHVYDSGSADETVNIARDFGATVTIRNYDKSEKPFGGDEACHRNWGLQNIRFKYPWVFVIDADERMTSDLVRALQTVIVSPGEFVAFRVQRRDFFLGRWLKHVTPSPFNIRLFKPEKVVYERLTNPITLVDGSIGQIEEHFIHFPFSKGIAHWIVKHNSYSCLEAAQIVANKSHETSFSIFKAFFCKNKNERRFHQKEIYYRMQFRPVIMFLLLYIYKRGFLDGRAGLTFAILRAIYEYFIVLKVRELEALENQDGSTRRMASR